MKMFSEIVSHIKEEALTLDECLEKGHICSVDDRIHPNISSGNIKCENKLEILENNGHVIYLKEPRESLNVKNLAEDSYCENCQDSFQDFCLKCSSLSQILDNEIPKGCNDNAEETIPNNILAIKETGKNCKGIFALKTIPKDVQFGPFCGLIILKKEKGYIWKIKCGKLMAAEGTQCLNWMQHINSVKDISCQNLMVFQYRSSLYFQTCKEIKKGSELLVHYGLENVKYVNDEATIYYRPIVEKRLNNIYVCTFCCIGLSSEIDLVKHKNKCPREVIRNSLFNIITQCPYCKIYILEREYDEFHSVYCNKDVRLFSVSQVNNTVTPGRENNHALNINAKPGTDVNKKCNCSFCGFKSNSKIDLTLHLYTHEKRNAFVCKLCNTQFREKRQLSAHLRNKNKCVTCTKAFMCKFCGTQFKGKQYLQFHIRNKHTPNAQKDYKCSKCSYETNIANALRRHMRLHFTNCDKSYKCPKCSFEASYKDSLKQHLYFVHEEDKIYECKLCEKHFNSKPNLTAHTKYVHNIIEESYSCTKCSYQTDRKHSLIRHLHTHDEAKVYTCKVCAKQFNHPGNFKQHARNKHKEEYKLESE